MVSLQTTDSFGICRVPTATGSSDSRGDTATTPSPLLPCPWPCLPPLGVLIPSAITPLWRGTPILPVTHLCPSQGHLGHRDRLSPQPGAQGSRGARGGTIALKIPAGLWGRCFFGGDDSPQPSWPQGFPHGLPKSSGEAGADTAWLSARRDETSHFPGAFSFPG